MGRLRAKDEQECPCESEQIKLLQLCEGESWGGRERGEVWIDGARSMINRPRSPIHFLLTLRALVTQMKMGGQGRSVMMIYVSEADVSFWRETV